VTEPLTLISFDYGEKRIGVAVGQTLTNTATPLDTIHVSNGAIDWDSITRILKQWHPQALVVGEPLNTDGSPQAVTNQCNHFVRELMSRFELPVYRIDERLSTYEAKSRLKATRNLDAVAAQAILETWLSNRADSVEHVEANNH